MTGRRDRRLRLAWVGAAFAAVALTFMAVAFLRTLEQVDRRLVPAWWQIAVAFALGLISLRFGFLSWRALLSTRPAHTLERGFYLAQLAKYIPGLVWQPVGQVGYTVRAGVGRGEAAAAFPVSAVVLAAAGGSVGAVLTFVAPEIDSRVRLAALAGLMVPLLLHRAWMRVLERWAMGMLRPGMGSDLLPGQRAILRSYVRAGLVMLSSGVSFAVLFWRPSTEGIFVAAAGIFALAWTAGFLAIPFPAGLGVREAVLVLGLAPVAAPAFVIAISVYHRLVSMLAELTILAVPGIWSRLFARGSRG